MFRLWDSQGSVPTASVYALTVLSFSNPKILAWKQHKTSCRRMKSSLKLLTLYESDAGFFELVREPHRWTYPPISVHLIIHFVHLPCSVILYLKLASVLCLLDESALRAAVTCSYSPQQWHDNRGMPPAWDTTIDVYVSCGAIISGCRSSLQHMVSHRLCSNILNLSENSPTEPNFRYRITESGRCTKCVIKWTV